MFGAVARIQLVATWSILFQHLALRLACNKKTAYRCPLYRVRLRVIGVVIKRACSSVDLVAGRQHLCTLLLVRPPLRCPLAATPRCLEAASLPGGIDSMTSAVVTALIQLVKCMLACCTIHLAPYGKDVQNALYLQLALRFHGMLRVA